MDSSEENVKSFERASFCNSSRKIADFDVSKGFFDNVANMNNVQNVITSSQKIMNLNQTANPVTLTWKNISVYASIVNSTKSRQNLLPKSCKKTTSKTIIDNMTGLAEPGKVLAVMGPSKCGKTTFFNALTNSITDQDMQMIGEVRVNSQMIGDQIKSMCAYVRYATHFKQALKVKEHLWFTAKLMMPTNTESGRNFAENWNYVLELMKYVGLEKCADTVIGEPGGVKGISGGEMKRLILASELLSNPQLMILDEPTAGLDVFMAENVIDLLRKFSRNNKTVIVSVNQASSEMFSMFDNLLLLESGRTVHLGSCQQAVNLFNNCQMDVPLNYNPADHFVHKISYSNKDELKRLTDTYEHSTTYTNMMQYVNKQSSQKYATEYTDDKLWDTPKYRVNLLQQIRVLIWRNWICDIRKLSLIAGKILQFLMLAAIMSVIFYDQPLDENGVQSMSAIFFVEGITLLFSVVYMCAPNFLGDLKIFYQDYHHRKYSVLAFYISKIIVDFPTIFTICLLYTSITYVCTINPINLYVFGYFFLTELLLCCASCSISYFFSAATNNISLMLALSTPYFVLNNISGGFYLNIESVNKFFAAARFICPTRYAYCINMVMHWIQKELHLMCSSANKNQSISIGNSGMHCYKSGEEVLNMRGFTEYVDRSIPFNFFGLVMLIIIPHIIAFFYIEISSL